MYNFSEYFNDEDSIYIFHYGVICSGSLDAITGILDFIESNELINSTYLSYIKREEIAPSLNLDISSSLRIFGRVYLTPNGINAASLVNFCEDKISLENYLKIFEEGFNFGKYILLANKSYKKEAVINEDINTHIQQAFHNKQEFVVLP